MSGERVGLDPEFPVSRCFHTRILRSPRLPNPFQSIFTNKSQWKVFHRMFTLLSELQG
jgi:hypothetical protein